MSDIKLFETSDSEADSRIHLIKPGKPIPFKKAIRWVLLGASSSGKTTLLKNIVLNSDWGYNKYYDEIYLFCGSLDDCIEMRILRRQYKLDKKVRITQKFDNDALFSLMTEIEKTNSELKDPMRVLFIFDDQICNDISSSHKRNVIDEIFMRGRHAAISAIVSTQKYVALNDNLRMLNIKYLTIFNGTNQGDLTAVSKEHQLPNCNYKETLAIIKSHIKEKYSSVTYDYVADESDRLKDSNFQPLSHVSAKLADL